MKKKWMDHDQKRWWIKLLLIMRLTTVFMLLTMLTVHAKTYSQQTKLSLSFQQTSIADVLSFIEEESEFYFFYKEDELHTERLINIDITKGNIHQILDNVLEGTNLGYSIVDRYIVISPKDGTNLRTIQQQISIGGKVTDSSGSPLPGVTVIIKGTSKGTVTDVEGTYGLTNVPGDAIVVFSFVGMKSEEIPVAGKSTIDVVMAEDAIGLEEVVAIGYGTEKKRDLTGAISTISGDNASKIPTSNFLRNLQGQTTGLQVTNGGGEAGGDTRVRVRGINSISSGTDPLWVIDGLIMSKGSFATINPMDIESFEILKDAAATAIYGSRGSNGVIIITTKKGSTSDTRTNVSVNTGISDVSRKPEDIGYLSTGEFFDVMDQALANTYGASAQRFDPNIHIIPSNYLLYPNVTGLTREQALATNTNWYDETMRIGKITDVNVSSSAQKEKMNFYVSFNYLNEKGVVKSNDFERFSGLVNLDFNVTKRLKVETKVNFSYVKKNIIPNKEAALGRGTEDTNTGGFAATVDAGLPWIPAYNEDGSYWNPTTPNLAMLANPLFRKKQLDAYRALMGIALEYSVPGVDGLKLRATASSDIGYSHYINYMHQALSTRGISVARDESYFDKDLVSDFYALFNRSFGKHKFNVSTGIAMQRISRFTSDVSGEEIIGQYMQLGTPNELTNYFIGYAVNNEHNLFGYFGRASYNYDDRYLVSLSMRRDGSSRFSKNNRWELFPAVGLGWIPSSESFWNVPVIDFLKLRASIGKTGNQNIPNVTVDSSTNQANRAYGTLVSAGTELKNVGSDVTWEVTNATDFGVETKLFNNRISLDLGYYKQDISRLLLAVPIAKSAGYGSLYSNIGDMSNQGWELSLGTINIETANFSWKTSFNLTTNKNEVTKLTPDLDNSGKGIASGRNITRTGSELGMFYVTEYAGVNPDNGIEQVYAVDADHYNETGETVFIMENGQPKKIPATPANIQNNRYIHEGKSGLPSYYGGLENTVKYKQFDLNFMLFFQGGNYILDVAEMVQSYPAGGTWNIRKDAATDTWTPENTDAKWPELRFEYIYDNYDNNWVKEDGKTANYDRRLEQNITTKFMHKGDYIRLKNLQLGYNFPNSLANKLNLNSARIYLQATNLFTITGYKGYDPDIIGTSGNVNLTQGYVPRQVTVPAIKTYSIGLNVQF